MAQFNDLPSGRYGYSVSAEGYMSVSSNTVLEAGKVQGESVYLPTEMVTYTWSVEPTTIQDKYDIKLKMTYKTDVEAPALIFEPRNTTLEMTDGETRMLVITVENKGIISAFNVKLSPTNADEAMVLTLPYTEIKELKAGEKVSIPVKIHLIHASCHEAEARASYDYTCAAGRTVTTNMEAFAVQGGYCPLSGGGGGTAGGGGSGGTEVGGGGGSGGGGSGFTLEAPPGTGSNCGTDSGGTPPPNPYIGDSCDKLSSELLQYGCVECGSDGKLKARKDGTSCKLTNFCVEAACRAGSCIASGVAKSTEELRAINQQQCGWTGKQYIERCPNRVNGPGNRPNKCSVPAWAARDLGLLTLEYPLDENKPLVPGPEFWPYCNYHDECYGWAAPKLQHTKEMCDTKLLEDLLGACLKFASENAFFPFSKYLKCRAFADIYYIALKNHPDSRKFYNEDQRDSTWCCDGVNMGTLKCADGFFHLSGTSLP